MTAACSYWAVPPNLGILGSEPRFYDDVVVFGLGRLGRLGLCAVQLLRPVARRLIVEEWCRSGCSWHAAAGSGGMYPSRKAPDRAVR